MSIFGSIRDAIFGKAKAQAAPAPAPSTAPTSAFPQLDKTPTAPAQPAMSQVDVEAVLDSMPGADKLNWRTSIVDLMKLVGMDASYDERKELAHEMGNADYSGTAEDNIRLHRQLMKQLAANGGKVPAKLLD